MENQNVISSVDSYKELAIEICKGRIRGVGIAITIFVCVFIIMLIIGRFKPPYIVLAALLSVVILIVSIPFLRDDYSMIKSIKNEDPVFCIVTDLGWERAGRRSVPVAYFIYDGTQHYAYEYHGGENGEIHEVQIGDKICVWSNGKTFVMVKAD